MQDTQTRPQDVKWEQTRSSKDGWGWIEKRERPLEADVEAKARARCCLSRNPAYSHDSLQVDNSMHLRR